MHRWPHGSLERARATLRCPVVALLLLLCLGGLVPASTCAQASLPDVWSGEWLLLEGTQSQGTLSGLVALATGEGLQLLDSDTPGTLLSPIHDMGRNFWAVAVLWEGTLPTGSALTLEVCTSADGWSWSDWLTLPAAEASGPDDSPAAQSTDLAFIEGRYVQLRATLVGAAGTQQAMPLPVLRRIKLIAIDPGESPQILPQVKTTGGPSIISRAGWGANESYRTWAPEYATVTHFIVHHTATSNDTADYDPAGVVRTIYYYHAVTLGWGDIGYNYLIDRQGRIYEGRYGGDGVIAGHARPYNPGTVGVAILGDYTASDVPQAALTGLVELLAWKANLHFIHPLQSSFLIDQTFPNIMGHRDCNVTTCPGDRAYAQMGWIRSATWERMRNIPPRVILNRPVANEQLSGNCTVSWRTSAAASQVTIVVDGQTRATALASAGSAVWNTATVADGTHTLRLTATTDLGQSAYVEVPIVVANGPPDTPPTGSVSAPTYTRDPTVILSLTCEGCNRMQFGHDWIWEGEDLYHQVGRLRSDSSAANGRAWEGLSGVDGAGAWYGPYFCNLPAGDYEAQFWLRCSAVGSGTTVADLDVSDTGGLRILAGPRAVSGAEFTSSSAYHLFRVPFTYPGASSSCQGAGSGLELRTWYKGTADLWLDRVEILTAPQTFATQASYTLGASDGSYTIGVRFVSSGGSVSSTYTRTIVLDRNAPRWGQPGAAGVPISDALSGLDTQAYYATSADGVTWSSWVTLIPQLSADRLSGTIPAQAAWRGMAVRFRARDRAGNEGISPPLYWPAADDPNPEYVWWKGLGTRTYLPLLLR